MNYNEPDDISTQDNLPVPDPAQQQKGHEGEEVADEEGTLLTEEDEKGMDMGTTFEAEKEQDLDDLIHSQATLKKSEFPGPDEV